MIGKLHIVEENHTLEGAGLCFICETAIPREKQAAINTGYVFDPPYQSQLTGQKYLCQGCAETIAYTIGYVSTVDVANAKHAINTIRAQTQEVADSVSSLASALVQEAGSLRDLPVFSLPDQVEAKAVTEKEQEESVGEKESISAG